MMQYRIILTVENNSAEAAQLVVEALRLAVEALEGSELVSVDEVTSDAP